MAVRLAVETEEIVISHVVPVPKETAGSVIVCDVALTRFTDIIP